MRSPEPYVFSQSFLHLPPFDTRAPFLSLLSPSAQTSYFCLQVRLGPSSYSSCLMRRRMPSFPSCDATISDVPQPCLGVRLLTGR